MASGILITAVLFFAVRGMFLGFSGVIARLVGFALGYLVAYHFRNPLAAYITSHSDIALPPIALQMISGLVLFIATMLISSALIKSLFKLLGKLLPGFNFLGSKDSTGSRLAGATVNGLIAAAVVLMGIWGYGKLSGKLNPEDELQLFANRFGDTVFTMVNDHTELDIQSFSTTRSYQHRVSSSQNSPAVTTRTTTGTAYIVSSDNPQKQLSIEQIREVIETNSDQLGSLVANPDNSTQLQELINNSELRDMALRQLQNNPEQFQQLLNNPQLQKMLEQFQTQTTN